MAPGQGGARRRAGAGHRGPRRPVPRRRRLLQPLAALAGVPEPRLDTISDRELTLLDLGDPFWTVLWETYHMSHRPFTVDATQMETTFGVAASPLDDVLKEMLTRR
ncbi:hypothetical protein LUW74_20675 [Actinomadura madurae]|uniref:hypothetical protein n=1 Tax=Actinomadura madurae TaxID=1993 RepID=UPI0020266618|nr:hypothetical protein [Actinomadura madurae]URN05488.1 hypothetical protein LUW74_20675 [Actinomadura madurae]